MVALLAFVIAQFVVLTVPLKMYEPDDWGFQYAANNFAQGHLTLTGEQYAWQSQEVWNAGGQLSGYAKVGDNRWALTRAPGYAFYLVPFERAGIPQLGASILSLGLVVVLYLLLARLKDEKTALFGVVLLIFTPLYLAMWQRVYMDTLAALAFCGVGGGLYLYYWLSRARLSTRTHAVVLFTAGFLLMVSVCVRYTNIVIAAVFGLHFLVIAVRAHLRRELFLPTGLFFWLGAALPLAGLLAYHGAVFGSPFSSGNGVAQPPISFAWSYDLGIGYSIVRGNISQLWAPLLAAMPVILVAVPAFATVAYEKRFFSGQASAWPELPAHIHHVLWGWVVAVFGLYVMYEWTSYQSGGQLPFPLLTRFYLPALLPLVIISALVLQRLTVKLWGSILVVLTMLGIIFFIQVTQIQTGHISDTLPPSLSLPVTPDNDPKVFFEEPVL